MNSKLAGTAMRKISFEGVVALKRAGLVSSRRQAEYTVRNVKTKPALFKRDFTHG